MKVTCALLVSLGKVLRKHQKVVSHDFHFMHVFLRTAGSIVMRADAAGWVVSGGGCDVMGVEAYVLV